MTIDLAGRTALITGASSGLGAEFARQLAARGSDLVLVARRAAQLDRLAAELRDAHGVTVTAHAVDLARPGIGVELRDQLAGEGIRISTLINNAGFATYNRFVEEDVARIIAEIQLDVTTLVELTHAFLPGLLADGTGALVNVASTAAFQPLPNMAIYGASKAFVLSLTEALAYEHRDASLKILALCPGPTRTEFFDVVGTDAAAVGRYQSAEQVVATALRALDRRSTPAHVVSGFGNRLSTAAVSVLPISAGAAMAGRLLA